MFATHLVALSSLFLSPTTNTTTTTIKFSKKEETKTKKKIQVEYGSATKPVFNNNNITTTIPTHTHIDHPPFLPHGKLLTTINLSTKKYWRLEID
ncbi:hypothetical protein PP707_00085 [Acetobacter pasteurianus]|nr:hypothetical protein [Acetobacter pasteurianus]